MERFSALNTRVSGWSSAVTSGVSLEDCIVQPLEDVSTLHLLPAGSSPLVPAAIFSNPRYISWTKMFSNIYDYIIIDAPPLDAASELLAIAKHVDGLIGHRPGEVTQPYRSARPSGKARINANVQLAGLPLTE